LPIASITFHPEAAAELKAAFLWYHERNPAVAESFRKEAIQAVNLVSESPMRWQEITLAQRKYVFPRFPFSLIYRTTENDLEIIAVAHQKRKPGYWKKR